MIKEKLKAVYDTAQFKVIVLSLLFIGLFVSVFYVPNQIERFAMFPGKFISGEYWRILTFQFSHLDGTHLIENILGVLFVGAIISQLKSKAEDYMGVMLLAGMIPVFLLLWFIDFPILGASAAVYGAFGIITLEASKYNIKREHIIGFIILAIFIQVVLYLALCGTVCPEFDKLLKQSLLHFLGFVTGIIIYIGLVKLKNNLKRGKSNILKRK